MQAHELFRHLRMPELGDVRQYVRTLPTNTLMGFGAFAALTTYWYATRPKALKPPCDLAMQSVEVEGSEHARRSSLLNSDELLIYYYDDVRTVYDIFRRGVHVSNNGPCLGSRKPNQPYEWISYKEALDRAECVGSALLYRGFKPSQAQYIGIFAQNRPEWVIIEQGCYAFSMVVVPLYDTLGTEAITYIVNKADLSLVFCDKPDKAKLLLTSVEKGETPVLNTIVIMEPFGIDLVERGKKCGVEVFSLREIEELGRVHRQKPMPPKPEDLAVICFTSGTTGNPKGAMITHQNIVSNTSAFVKATEKAFTPSSEDILISFLPLAHMFERIVEVGISLFYRTIEIYFFLQNACLLNPSDTHYSFLPLAHMFERLVECVILCHGARIGFFQGDIRLLMDDLKTLQPTVFPVVPRLLNRMFDKIFGQANTSLKRWMLDFASKRKEAELRSGIIRNNSFWDKFIFRKIQASLGGKVRLMVTGAAPVSASVLTFLRTALGCQFYEGYGQTECTAGCSLSLPGDWTAGHVGAPMPCNIIKLVDVEEMNYLAVKGEGEVCVKGPNVFHGYLKDPEKTAEALDKDGWLHTGDIGKWLPNGTLKIIDRKKHIFKLAQGEYIAPEKIENVYLRSEPLAQVFVHGESLQAFLIAIVVPDPETLCSWAKKRGSEGSYEELCKNKDLKKLILEDMVRIGKESGLKSFEQVKDIAMHAEMFSIENGLLTPTLKAKRPELRKYFKSQIDELYANAKM
ncbi:long-chain-fatty-acid--CoA ligase 1 isoform X1 [Apteryx rowi]|uniref:long-chain-fatty-acid--CoA ligase 1 isoform X1 n=1 Tax=Apteryx rowi TaxID=308060 RepID=UPI000E1CB318|nr:long-chain-fatty-acid--CoA ligase 1 isoform X1 [Apteryx rowi]XP_025939865.1 long-chain-fatty-acid--CoA ligase 1 isoform X1 [Apteryx rowi]